MLQRKGLAILLLLTVFLTMSSCGRKQQETRSYENAQDVVYEIVTGSDVPHKVNEKIYKAKEKSFGFSYRDGDSMYVVFGFGRQNTGGYSIEVVAVKENEEAIIVEAKMVAPAPEEVISTSPSYPYMILKMANVEKDVQFILY